MIIPRTQHAVIKFCRLVLNKDDVYQVTFNDLDIVRCIMQHKIDSGLSPREIKEEYSIQYSNFSAFLKHLNINLKTVKNSVINYYKKSGGLVTDRKKIYKKQCSFTFNPYTYPNIMGYHLLVEFGIYHPTQNPNGVCRDHIISIEYGWRNDIDPTIVSHPANCQYLLNQDNIRKGSAIGMKLEDLIKSIHEWGNNSTQKLTEHYKQLPKSTEHKSKIKTTNSQYMSITDGHINKRVLKTTEIPVGWRRGMTRKNSTGDGT